jgi:hypothetical protein
MMGRVIIFTSKTKSASCILNIYVRKTSRLLLPLPATSDETMWEKEGANYIYLTEHGINHLRAAIRVERKARVELFLMWMPGVVGILGALIGLAAILMQKK